MVHRGLGRMAEEGVIMAVAGDINIKIDRLAGVNQNEAGRLPNELDRKSVV